MRNHTIPATITTVAGTTISGWITEKALAVWKHGELPNGADQTVSAKDVTIVVRTWPTALDKSMADIDSINHEAPDALDKIRKVSSAAIRNAGFVDLTLHNNLAETLLTAFVMHVVAGGFDQTERSVAKVVDLLATHQKGFFFDLKDIVAIGYYDGESSRLVGHLVDMVEDEDFTLVTARAIAHSAALRWNATLGNEPTTTYVGLTSIAALAVTGKPFGTQG